MKDLINRLTLWMDKQRNAIFTTFQIKILYNKIAAKTGKSYRKKIWSLFDVISKTAPFTIAVITIAQFCFLNYWLVIAFHMRHCVRVCLAVVYSC